MTYTQQSQEQRSPCTPRSRFKPVISPLATLRCVLTQSKPQRSDLIQPAGEMLVRDSVSSACRVQSILICVFPHPPKQFSSVQSLSHLQLSVTHGLQHARPPCPSWSPRMCSNSCSLSKWCHPTISSSVAFFSSCPQFFPASESFPMSWLFTSDGPSIEASASASVLPMNIQLISFRIYWFDLLAHTKGMVNSPGSKDSSDSSDDLSLFFPSWLTYTIPFRS